MTGLAGRAGWLVAALVVALAACSAGTVTAGPTGGSSPSAAATQIAVSSPAGAGAAAGSSPPASVAAQVTSSPSREAASTTASEEPSPAADAACLRAAPLSLVRSALGSPSFTFDHAASTPPQGFPTGPGYVWSFCLFTAPSGPADGELAVVVGSYTDASVVRSTFAAFEQQYGATPVGGVGDAAFFAADRGAFAAIRGTGFVELAGAELPLDTGALRAAEQTIAVAALAAM